LVTQKEGISKLEDVEGSSFSLIKKQFEDCRF